MITQAQTNHSNYYCQTKKTTSIRSMFIVFERKTNKIQEGKTSNRL